MSTETEDSGGDMSLGPGSCRNAEQYVLMRLEGEGGPMKAADLAGEYECTNGHMRRALNNLREEGAVERVERGVYALTSGDESSESPETDGTALPGAGATEPDSFGVDDRPSTDGPARSDDTDGPAGDQAGDDGKDLTVPTEQVENVDVQDDRIGEEHDRVDGAGEENEVPALFPIPKTAAYVAVAAVLLFVAWKVYQEHQEQQEQQASHQHREQRRYAGHGLWE